MTNPTIGDQVWSRSLSTLFLMILEQWVGGREGSMKSSNWQYIGHIYQVYIYLQYIAV